LCPLKPSGFGECIGLAFLPTGVGVTGSSRVFAAEARKARLHTYVLGAGKLAPGPVVMVGRNPHGTAVQYKGNLYVPIERGVAVVDVRKLRQSRPIALPSTPAGIWIAPASGRLFAALYPKNETAIVNTVGKTAAPKLLGTGLRPVVVGGDSTGRVFVVNA